MDWRDPAKTKDLNYQPPAPLSAPVTWTFPVMLMRRARPSIDPLMEGRGIMNRTERIKKNASLDSPC